MPQKTQKILLMALTLFAVAGLLVGFTVGRLTHQPKITPTPVVQGPGVTPTVAVTPTIAAKATVDVSQVRIGCPDIRQVSGTQNADGATPYTFSAQIMDKSIDNKTACGKGNPLLAPNITCKLWFTQDGDSINNLQKNAPDMLKAGTLQTPFPGEAADAVTFDTTTPQVQPCSQTGQTSWKYTLAPTVKSGTYYLAVIADWKGTYYNWRSRQIEVKGQA